MPTVAQTPRARVLPRELGAVATKSAPWTPRASATRPARRTRRIPLDTAPACDASRAPVPPLPPGDLAGVRREQGAGAAAAPWTPRRRATRAARRCGRSPLATWPACDASRAPDTPQPPGHRAAVETARPPQSTAPPCCIHTTLSAPRGITFMRRSRTSHESGASHQASFASDWHAQRASEASTGAKKNPTPCYGAGQGLQRCQYIRRRWAPCRRERPSGRLSGRGHSS